MTERKSMNQTADGVKKKSNWKGSRSLLWWKTELSLIVNTAKKKEK